MKNISENKVILTDEKYKSVRSDVVIWYIGLVVKSASIALLIFVLRRLQWFFIPADWFVHRFALRFDSAILFFIVVLMCGAVCLAVCLIIGFVLLVILNIAHELQITSQCSLDGDFLGEGEDWHFLEIFPGKAIRLAHREMRRYRRQKRLQEKGHKEKQQESKDDNSSQ